MPVAVVQVDDRDVVFRVVERRFDLRGALESDLPLGGVAARQEGDFEFSIVRVVVLLPACAGGLTRVRPGLRAADLCGARPVRRQGL